MSWRSLLSSRPGALFLALAVGSAGACGSSPVDVVAIDPSNLTQDLVAHWTFDDGGGTAVADRSGKGHDGVLSGDGMWLTDGKFGGALYLPYGTFVSVAAFPYATDSWTVSVWTRTSATDLAAIEGQESTIISAETVFAGGWQMHLDNRPNYRRFDAAYWSGPEQMDYVVAYCSCIAADQWIHLTAVWDAAVSTMTLYHDDQAVDQRPMPTHIKPGDSTLMMGTWNMNNRFLVGAIDDFAIWSRALQRAEIAALSHQPPN